MEKYQKSHFWGEGGDRKGWSEIAWRGDKKPFCTINTSASFKLLITEKSLLCHESWKRYYMFQWGFMNNAVREGGSLKGLKNSQTLCNFIKCPLVLVVDKITKSWPHFPTIDNVLLYSNWYIYTGNYQGGNQYLFIYF